MTTIVSIDVMRTHLGAQHIHADSPHGRRVLRGIVALQLPDGREVAVDEGYVPPPHVAPASGGKRPLGNQCAGADFGDRVVAILAERRGKVLGATPAKGRK